MIDEVRAINNEKLILKAVVPLYDQTEFYNNRHGIIAKKNTLLFNSLVITLTQKSFY
tara:strand:- start:2148 stop:2318 length:171 start_codon:yes stop_codon:yes gene_type:complete